MVGAKSPEGSRCGRLGKGDQRAGTAQGRLKILGCERRVGRELERLTMPGTWRFGRAGRRQSVDENRIFSVVASSKIVVELRFMCATHGLRVDRKEIDIEVFRWRELTFERRLC